jgi:Circadian oscillating protein COP23
MKSLKSLKSNSSWLGLLLTFTSMSLLPMIQNPDPGYSLPTTVFECRVKGKDFVTMAKRGNRLVGPMITWTDKSFGTYTPQKRCQIVSQRLTKAVSTSGTLNSLRLSNGMVNNKPVICFILKDGDKCNSENLLFTLKSNEIGQEKKIISELLDFSKLGSGKSTKRATKETYETYGAAIDAAFAD